MGAPPPVDSTSYDRHLYMTNNGRLVFGTYDGSTRTIQNSTALNNNAWHHAVATQSSAGMKPVRRRHARRIGRRPVPPRRTTSGTGASAGTTSAAGLRRRAPSTSRERSMRPAVYPYALTWPRCRRTTASARASRRRPPPSRRPATDLDVAFDASASAPAGLCDDHRLPVGLRRRFSGGHGRDDFAHLHGLRNVHGEAHGHRQQRAGRDDGEAGRGPGGERAADSVLRGHRNRTLGLGGCVRIHRLSTAPSPRTHGTGVMGRRRPVRSPATCTPRRARAR